MLPRWLASLTSLPFPVMMIVGVLVGKKMYSLLKYLFTMLIALFMYKNKAGKASGGSADSLVGTVWERFCSLCISHDVIV